MTIGDFATTKVPGAFSLVYLVYNAISNLTTQDEQVACFRNAAGHLAPVAAWSSSCGCPTCSASRQARWPCRSR